MAKLFIWASMVFLFGILLVGCGVLDWASGINADGQDLPGPSPAETARDLVGGPWGVVLTGAAALWAAIRGRAWKKAAVSTFETVEAFGQTPQGAAVIGDLKNRLSKNHTVAGVYGLVEKVVSKFGS